MVGIVDNLRNGLGSNFSCFRHGVLELSESVSLKGVTHHDVAGGVGSEEVIAELLTVNFLNEFILNVFLILFALIDEVVLDGELVSHHAGSSGVASEEVIGEHIVKVY